ncbi:glutamine amidotransferase [Halomonas campisalis]|uniref:Glutamine amidotransferase n=1 Tax=Billgrantia campisalis TaxID=74661 RepID=A0ABS9PC51_9GAMM|nr:glutamine amidotransferase [Halomonas campisalis]MCG6659341.1 glutamine amidotransferase [Halomonas campisalis]MDR5863943.1 glutamine amidotransferase [Halomonas campisalis]
MPRLLIVKTGDAFPEVVETHGDFEALFQQALAGAGFAARVFDARREPLPDLAEIDGLYITGSHSMVSHAEPWSEALKPWLIEARERNLPMLGVCYGHQLMAAAYGGMSDFHPARRESGTHPVTLTEAGREDALLGALPERFPAQLTHAQSVLQAPADAVVLARNAHDAHQALRYGPRQWSVQFHPEFTAPVMRAYLARQVDALRDQGQDPEALIEGVAATPEAGSLLATFAKRVAAWLETTPHR